LIKRGILNEFNSDGKQVINNMVSSVDDWFRVTFTNLVVRSLLPNVDLYDQGMLPSFTSEEVADLENEYFISPIDYSQSQIS
jgi:hypothetical protein